MIFPLGPVPSFVSERTGTIRADGRRRIDGERKIATVADSYGFALTVSGLANRITLIDFGRNRKGRGGIVVMTAVSSASISMSEQQALRKSAGVLREVVSSVETSRA